MESALPAEPPGFPTCDSRPVTELRRPPSTGMDGRPAPGRVYGLVVADRARPAVPGPRASAGPATRRWARPVMNASA